MKQKDEEVKRLKKENKSLESELTESKEEARKQKELNEKLLSGIEIRDMLNYVARFIRHTNF